MHLVCRWLAVVALGFVIGIGHIQAADAPSLHLVQVQLSATAAKPLSGRLLLFAEPLQQAKKDAQGKVAAVNVDGFKPTSTDVAAREVWGWHPGRRQEIDGDELAYPRPFSSLPPGDYVLQAVLDTHHNYNYAGRVAGDWVTPVITVHLPADQPITLTLDHAIPATDAWQLPSNASAAVRALEPELRAHAQRIDFVSGELSAFWGRQIMLRGRILLPPDYQANARTRYPTVYYTQGFSGDNDGFISTMREIYQAMHDGQMPPMIWVFLDESVASGTQEFADSVNNGPWGRALTSELIPSLEKQYRMDGKPSGRFLTGHSSGGWATLWLQLRYPKMFGGTWSSSPDPVDFHDFFGVNLYSQQANMYRSDHGLPRPMIRLQDKVVGTIEQFARNERVIGAYGGQMASYEWVFSPRGADGRPQPLFDRDNGDIDPQVAAYWIEHYDITRHIREHWPQLRKDLDGKIHLYVGTDDTFYLDGPVRRLKAVLDQLQAHADIRFYHGRDHFDLYQEGDDDEALLKQISWQMYQVARPGVRSGDGRM